MKLSKGELREKVLKILQDSGWTYDENGRLALIGKHDFEKAASLITEFFWDLIKNIETSFVLYFKDETTERLNNPNIKLFAYKITDNLDQKGRIKKRTIEIYDTPEPDIHSPFWKIHLYRNSNQIKITAFSVPFTFEGIKNIISQLEKILAKYRIDKEPKG